MNPIAEKIQKLLALSQSPNENEAAAAAQKMSELLTRHNLSLADLGGQLEEELQAEDLTEPTGRMDSWKPTLYRAIAQLNYCSTWTKKRELSKIVILGRPTNVMACRQLAKYLESTIKRLAKEAADQYQRETLTRPRGYTSSFKTGCALRLAERLQEQYEQRQEEGIAGTVESAPISAIVCKSMDDREKAAVTRWMADSGLRLTTTKTRSSVSSQDGYRDGNSAANAIGLNVQLNAGKVRSLHSAR